MSLSIAPPVIQAPAQADAEERPDVHAPDVLEHISTDLVPAFLTLRHWPDNVRKDFLEQFYKSMVCTSRFSCCVRDL
jgi:hypothetical protein